MRFYYILLMSIVFSLGIASATITLNTPADGEVSTTNQVILNGTVVLANNVILKNVSLWDNSTGIWKLNQTQRTQLNEAHGQTFTSTGADVAGAKNGLKILVKDNNITVKAVYKTSDSNPTTAYITDSSRNVLATASFSGDVATFNYNLTAGTTYYILADNPSVGYTRSFTGSNTYPINGELLNFTSGASNSGDTAVIYNIVSLDVNVRINNYLAQFTKTINKDTLWGLQDCNNNSICEFSSNRTVLLDRTPPYLNIIYPNSLVSFGYMGQNLSLNYSITDPQNNVQSCWQDYNGSNVSISCTGNSSIILSSSKSIRVYANDSIGNVNFTQMSWDYGLFLYSPTYNLTEQAGATSSFLINTTYNTSVYNAISAMLNYKDNLYSAAPSGLGNSWLFTNTLLLNTSMVGNANPFLWQFSLGNATNTYYFNSSMYNQTVSNLLLDNCTTYTNLILNYTLYDEDSRTPINGTAFNSTIEVAVLLYSQGSNVLIGTYNQSYKATNNAKVCIQSLNTTYSMNYQTKYLASNYSTEYKFGQSIVLSNTTIPQNVALYDLISSESQRFNIAVQGSNLNILPGVLVDIQRQYIPINQFISVETPQTDSNGNVVGNLIVADAVYNFLIYQNGILLGTFNNYRVKCANQLTGDCSIVLNLAQATVSLPNFNNYGNISYQLLLNSNSSSIQMPFISTDGNSHLVRWTVILNDGYGNNTICSDSSLTTSGTFSCSIPQTYTNSSLWVSVYSDGTLLSNNIVSLASNGSNVFGNTRIILGMLMYSTLTLLFFSDPRMLIIGSMLGMSFAGAFLLIDGIGLVSAGAVFAWFFVAAGILIWQINRRIQ